MTPYIIPPITELPPAPDYVLTDDGRAEWARAGAILVAAGRLHEGNVEFLGIYCEMYGHAARQRRAGTVPILIHELARWRRDLGIVAPDDEVTPDMQKPNDYETVLPLVFVALDQVERDHDRAVVAAAALDWGVTRLEESGWSLERIRTHLAQLLDTEGGFSA
jgi:hypothetical protein